MSENSNKSTGTSIAGLLGIAFVVLKLCGVINWPWIWVTVPFWGLLALFLVVLLIGYAGISVFGAFQTRGKKKKRKDEFIEDVKPLSKWEQRMQEMKKNKL